MNGIQKPTEVNKHLSKLINFATQSIVVSTATFSLIDLWFDAALGNKLFFYSFKWTLIY